ncbi:MAG: DUF2264 domain-containing protein [Coprobacillus sp.]
MLNNLKQESKSCNQLKTREDIICWMKELMQDPFQYKEKTGSGYGKDIREFEYVSRQLWGVFALIASDDYDQELILPYIKRIKAGLQENSDLTFPYPTTKTRQIAVEMAVYGFGLLSCKDKLLRYFDENEISFLSKWLNSMNDIELPLGNWLFFLLIVNYGLKINGLPYNESKIQFASQQIEEFYVGDGWYQDGHPSQRDYYIPFAFHFYSLLIKCYCPNIVLQDVEKRSLRFEDDYVYWMDSKGRTLPYGRSLTYRFAHSCYYSACAVSGIHSHSLGMIKHMIFNHLNYWKKQNIMQDELLSIGYGYPNLILSEDYNAPGSPMWAMKTFVILALPSSHAFWECDQIKEVKLESIYKVEKAGFLFVTGKQHHYALSAGQYSRNKILQHMSKYGKFCYSTAFGWNLSRDVQGIHNFAVDNALALSVLGTEQFVSRGEIQKYNVYDNYAYSCWNYQTIASVESWLIPINEDCHVRLHKIDTQYPLETYEGAFPVFEWNPKFDKPDREYGLCISKDQMMSGIVDLLDNRQYEIVLQNPNTNIYNYERNAIPTLKGIIQPGTEIFGCIIYGCLSKDKHDYCDIKLNKNILSVNHKKIILKEM